MCGIAGLWQAGASPCLAEVAGRMAEQLAHRGPDDAGVWRDDAAGLALSHRRLSIIDLSPAGYQPMISPCERYALVFNGEIYNHQELRAKLDREGGAFEWRGHSDTETLLAALRFWGVDAALGQLNGMFAFALWDRKEQSLFLVRDRMGEKPLYYGSNNGAFLFASELKAFSAYPQWRADIDPQAVGLYLRHRCIPAPWSIYRGIYKVPPAHYVVIREQGRNFDGPHCYWNLREAPVEDNAFADDRTLIDELDRLLRDSVRQRMIADVPLGAFLSGGVDSSTIVALMQAQSTERVRTFSIGFREDRFDEARHARAIADHLGTEHAECYVEAQDALDLIPDLPRIWDEPFSDPAQVPTYIVSRLAREHVKVSLTGDGGDEMFLGYAHHHMALQFHRLSRHLPYPARLLAGALLGRLPIGGINRLGRRLRGSLRHEARGDRLHKLADMLRGRDGREFYERIITLWGWPDAIGVNVELERGRPHSRHAARLTDQELARVMTLIELGSQLPNQYLVKTDRASMANGLEVRVPLIDHRIAEFSARLPLRSKYRSGQGKWLLRQVLHRYVPRSLVDRPKQGFILPIEHWLRGPLRDWAESLLDERRLDDEGFFNPRLIRDIWDSHLCGHSRQQQYLWTILMFQAWLESTR